MKKDLKKRFFDKVKKNKKSGCWEWSGCKDKDGYGVFYFVNPEDGSKESRAHRVSLIINKGFLDKNKIVLHKCHNRKCVNPDHIMHGSQSENIRHSVKRGTHVRVRFTDDQVIEMSEKRLSGWASTKIADFYKTNPATVDYATKKRINLIAREFLQCGT